jgi:hypothetical protein
MLLRSDQLADDRRVTVADHAKWRDELKKGTAEA